MVHSQCPPQVPDPQPLPPARRKALNAAKFWTLMERWKIPCDRALNLIGQTRLRRSSEVRPFFRLSGRQAQVLSCLMEIDLTLTLAALENSRHRKLRASPTLTEAVPLESLGRCDPSRAATVLWSLQESHRYLRRPR
jgi:hypothetical protein